MSLTRNGGELRQWKGKACLSMCLNEKRKKKKMKRHMALKEITDFIMKTGDEKMGTNFENNVEV